MHTCVPCKQFVNIGNAFVTDHTPDVDAGLLRGRCVVVCSQGAGVTDKHPHLDPVRHTAQKFKQVLGVDRSNYNTEWQITNRSEQPDV